MNFETKYNIGDKVYVCDGTLDSVEEVSITRVSVSCFYDPLKKEPVTTIAYSVKNESFYQERDLSENLIFKTKKDFYRFRLKEMRQNLKRIEERCQNLQKLIKEEKE